MTERTLVLRSRSIFTASGDSHHAKPFEGFVAIRGNRIEAVGSVEEGMPYFEAADEVLDMGDGTIMPGLVDVHTFYTGWELRRLGADLSRATSIDDVVTSMRNWLDAHTGTGFTLGMNLPAQFVAESSARLLREALNAAFGKIPAVAFTIDAATCVLNGAATARYGFGSEACYAEKIWRLMADYLRLPEARADYTDYMSMLNARGVTSVKEMCFDDYYGFADEMFRRETAGELTVRIDMMSQPVGRGVDLEYGRRARERFRGPFVRFSGYNRMTDRGVWCGLAEMIEAYEEGAEAASGKRVAEEPEWGIIEKEVRSVDTAGFRYSLHCQGDGAVRHAADLYETLPRDVSGRLKRRHAITDLENSDPVDLKRLGALGVICEIYPQILTLDNREDCLSMMRRQIGSARLRRSWNRRDMEDAGCVVCCGTDLPLLLPSVGDAIYSACGGYFADGLSVNEANTLTVAELLRALTAGGAYDLIRENELGTLEPGKLADVCVLDRDVFAVDPRDARSIRVALTISDGHIVYRGGSE